MRLLTLTCLVAPASALALQPVLGRSAVRSAAAVRAATIMQHWKPPDPEGTRDGEELDEEAKRAALIAYLRKPQRQFDGGWGDTAGRYGGKVTVAFKDRNRADAGEVPIGGTNADGTRALRSGEVGATLPAEKQAQCVLPEESFKVEKMEMSQTDEDYEMVCALDKNEMEAEMFIDIEPMFLTKEEYFFGFTSDSDPKISIDHSFGSPIEGVMNAKSHAENRGSATMGSLDRADDTTRIMIKLKFKPGVEVGEFVSYLCFIFPNEPHFSKFYKITGKSTNS